VSTPVTTDTEVVLTVSAPAGCTWDHAFTPRDEEILDAVIACVTEDGLARMSVADIAERAHASKATLYRRFGSREGLILAAFQRQARAGWAPADTGNLRDDLVHCATKIAHHMTHMGSTLVELGAEMRHNPELARMMRSEFLISLNELIEPAFARGRERGEVTESVDTALIWESVKATLLYRIVFLGEPVGELPAQLVDRIVMPAVSSCAT
jgi:AcrR family transcriptional regulator